MPKACAVIDCGNTSSETVSLHKVPQDDNENRWKDFVSTANREYDWKETKIMYLCSLHFKDECFVGPKLWRRRITRVAVPTLLNGNEITLPSCMENRIKPLTLFDGVKFSFQKSSNVENPISENDCQIQLAVNEDAALQEQIREKDETILKLTKDLEHEKNELRNCKRRLNRSEVANQKLKEKAAAPPPKIQKLQPDPENVSVFKTLLLQIMNRKHSRGTYSDEIKEFAYSVHYLSPSTYKFLRETFQNTLPHPRNFSRWTSHIETAPGFLSCSLEHIRNRLQDAKERILFSLSLDEIHIRKQILYRDGKLIGFTNYGGISPEPAADNEASAALFVVATEINGSFKVPIGYILTNGLPAAVMAQVISQSLQKMHEVGATVLSITFDGLSSNLKAVKILGANLDPFDEDFSPFILHPSSKEKVYIFMDPSHMLKLLRNFFKTCDITDSLNRKISWSYIEALHQLQISSGLRAANKLTSRHVSFESQKMKTRLCAQTLSNSVAVSLAFCRKIGMEEFAGSEGTEAFLRCLDRLFDALNSRCYGKGFKAPLSGFNEEVWTEYFDFCKSYLLGLEIVYKGKKMKLIDSPKGTPVKGLIVSMRSLQLIMLDVVPSLNITFLPTYRLGQDMIETFFSLIRSRFGFNNNPNIEQLLNALKGILCAKLHEITSGNCVELEELSSKISCFQSLKNIILDEEQNDSIDLSDEPALELSQFVQCIVTYIAGFVTRSLMKNLKCVDCLLLLYPSDEEELEHNELISEKDNGGLVKPSSTVVAVCKLVEEKVRQFESLGLRNMQSSKISDAVVVACSNNGVRETLNCSGNSVMHEEGCLLKAIINEYLKVRLHHLAKEKTLALNPTTNRSVCNKMVHYKGN